MTRLRPYAPGRSNTYSSKEEAQFAFHSGNLHLQAPVNIRIDGKLLRQPLVELSPMTFCHQHCLTVISTKY